VLAFALPSPNPADARTTLQYTLPRAGIVRLGVYDASGRLVRELASGTREAGQQTEAWDLRDASGRTVGAGLYFARLETDGHTLVRRVAVAH
jgi:flagellar hook assembly protein FlgD